MRLLLICILLIMTSCGSGKIVDGGHRINLIDLGTHIDISDSKYGGTLIVNLGFYEECSYIKMGSGISSTSRRLFDSQVEIYNNLGQLIGSLVSNNGITISSNSNGIIYEFKKIYDGGSYLIYENGQKVGSIRIYDEKRISVILYKEVDFDILIHSIYYLQ